MFSVETRKLSENLGAEIVNIDLADGVSDDAFDAVYAAFLQHQVLVFRSTREVEPRHQVEFAKKFGEVQIHVMNQYHASGYPELYTLTNLDESGNPSGKHPDKGTLAWHTDGSWMKRTGLATFMYAVEVPTQGGETHFADMHGAWDRLDDATRTELTSLKAIHNLDFSRNRRHGEEPMTDEQRAAVPPVAHPIMRTHPETSRVSVFLGDHAESIQGMPYEDGRAYIDDLNRRIIHEDLIYRHRWSDRELVVWDNRSVLHMATPYDTANARRVIRRCTVLGDSPR